MTDGDGWDVVISDVPIINTLKFSEVLFSLGLGAKSNTSSSFTDQPLLIFVYLGEHVISAPK